MPFGIEFRSNDYFVEVTATPLYWTSGKNTNGLRITGSVRNKEDDKAPDCILVSFSLMFRLQFGGCYAESSIEQSLTPMGDSFDFDVQNMHQLATTLVDAYRSTIGAMLTRPSDPAMPRELFAYVGENEFHTAELGLAVAPIINDLDVLVHVFGPDVPSDVAEAALDHLGNPEGLWLSAFREAMQFRTRLAGGDVDERMAWAISQLRSCAGKS